MTLLGQIIDAHQAERIGLVNRVTEPGKAVEVSMDLGAEIASRGPLAVREAKRAIDLAGDISLDEGLAVELDASERIFDTDDMIEGATAFLEKRPPRFRGE
jgi:enoyl-CoA hydratase/carnithine racemase